MKKTSALAIIMLLVCLCSCNKKSITKTQVEPEDDSTDSENINVSEYQKDNDDETVSVLRSTADNLAYYSELYSVKAVYRDKFNGLKYILVGEKNIVEILAIEDLNQTKVIARDNIERVENNSVAGFNEIKAFDKTNHIISVILDSDEAEELLCMLDDTEN